MSLKNKHITTALEVKEIGEDGTLKGYGSVFGVVDSYRDIVMPGAFQKSIEAHMAKGSMPAMLWQHDHRMPIGVWKSMTEDSRGLVLEGQLALGTNKGREVRELLRMGAVRGLSIGFAVKSEEWDGNEKINRLKEIDLWETSIVTFPANEEAMVDEVRSDFVKEALASKRNLERFLRDAGLPRSVAVKLAAAWDEGDDQSDSDLSALIESVKRATNLIFPKGNNHV